MNVILGEGKCVVRCIFIFILGLTQGLFAVASIGPLSFPTKPFWQNKPKLEQRLREERAVLVSVHTGTGARETDAQIFTINGVGWVKQDVEVVFSIAKQFERLKKVSDVFQEVKYESKTNRVFVRCRALGYQARMLIEVEVVDAPNREIRFHVIEGHFVGLKGVMGFRPLNEQSRMTEVSLRVLHEAREIPIPKILVGLALEIVVQKVAVEMRAHFEN